MTMRSRWLAPAVLAAGLGIGAVVPAPAHAQDEALVRVRVDVADVVMRNGQPYYRHGGRDGRYDRLVVARDRHGRPVYYRVLPRSVYYPGNPGIGYRYDARYRPPYGHAYGYYDNVDTSRRVKCSSNGNCTVKYYDPRYDRRGYRGYDDGHRRRDGRRGRHQDDD